jgi:hypothetical protein
VRYCALRLVTYAEPIGELHIIIDKEILGDRILILVLVFGYKAVYFFHPFSLSKHPLQNTFTRKNEDIHNHIYCYCSFGCFLKCTRYII